MFLLELINTSLQVQKQLIGTVGQFPVDWPKLESLLLAFI